MPTRGRFAPALIAALALHAGIAVVLALVSPDSLAVAQRAISVQPTASYEVELEPVAPAEGVQEPAAIARAQVPVVEPASRGHGLLPRVEQAPASTPEVLTAPEGTVSHDGAWSISPKRKGGAAPAPVASVDLAVGPSLSWRLVDNPNHRRAPGVELGEETAGGLRPALDEHDREMGLGRGGAILSQLQTAAGIGSAPIEGKAMLEVTVDTRGSVWVGVSQSNHPGWTKVASQLATQLKGTHFRIPPGARGLKFQIEVDARVVEYDGSKKPAGTKLELSPGKIGDNKLLEKMPGLYLSGGNRVCQYQVGLIPIPNQPLNLAGWCDPTKLVVAPQRLVSARVVGETRL